MVERLSKLEANRRLRKRIDRIKSEFAKIDNYFAEKRDERDLSEEEYVRRWHRSKGWREEERVERVMRGEEGSGWEGSGSGREIPSVWSVL